MQKAVLEQTPVITSSVPGTWITLRQPAQILYVDINTDGTNKHLPDEIKQAVVVEEGNFGPIPADRQKYTIRLDERVYGTDLTLGIMKCAERGQIEVLLALIYVDSVDGDERVITHLCGELK